MPKRRSGRLLSRLFGGVGVKKGPKYDFLVPEKEITFYDG